MLLGKRLEQVGHEVFFFSGDTAYTLLKKEFKQVYPCAPIAWYENALGINVPASLINILFPLPVFNADTHRVEVKSSVAMEVIHRYYDLRKNLLTIAPDMIIADGDISALRIASKWHIPSIYIANLIRPNYGFMHYINSGDLLITEYVKQCKKIVAPDNPPPYTISDYSIGNMHGTAIENKIEYIGSFTDITLTQGSDDHIFAPISGPIGTRSKILNTLIPTLQKTSNSKVIISLGIPGKNTITKIGNCEVHTWLSPNERQEAMKNAKYVIFSGGHTTCFETIKYAKPSICIPTQPEQGGNAAKLQDLGCSIKVKNQKELEKAMKKIEQEQAIYKKNVLNLNKFSNKFNGLNRAVEIVETLLN
jgi:uncharacterized protein (TIGR00661 family)